MARGGRDVVAVARIVAAQRAVRPLDDPLGAFDDPVERRAKDLVERMVELAAARRRHSRRRCSIDRCTALEAGEAAVRRRDDFAAKDERPLRFRGAAARALPGESRVGRRAQLISGISPSSFSSRRRTRVSGLPIASSASMPSFSARSAEREMMRKSSFGGPFLRRTAQVDLLRREAPRMPQARSRGSAMIQPLQRQRDFIAFRRRANPQLDVMIGRGRDGVAVDRHAELPREPRDRQDLRKGKLWPDVRPGLALQRFKLRIGRNQPVLRRRGGRDGRSVQTERWPPSPPNAAQCRTICRIELQAIARTDSTCVGSIASNRAISVPRSLIPTRSPSRASSRAAISRDTPASRSSRIEPSVVAVRQIIPAQPRR